MNIGTAARLSGNSAKMIRHYEEIGLVAGSRLANGYRDYSPSDIATLRFIRHARALAFPLEDVRKLLALWGDRNRASADVQRIALSHVAALESKAQAMQAMAASLRHLATHCCGDTRPDCPILDELEKPVNDTMVLKVAGMSCDHCARAVTQAIRAGDPGADVQVDVAAGTVRATTASPRAAIVAAITEEGYVVEE
jgi:Cu(I)-responsive transcriptional regulator